MGYWIVLILYILIGIYDLYLYAIAKVQTITQRVHVYAEEYPRFVRIIMSFFFLGFSWYLGGIRMFIPTLSGWLLCHLIGWDF